MATGCDTPLGVGRLAVDASELKDRGKRGKAVGLMHCWGDHLWTAGKTPVKIAFTLPTDDSDEDESEEEDQSTPDLNKLKIEDKKAPAPAAASSSKPTPTAQDLSSAGEYRSVAHFEGGHPSHDPLNRLSFLLQTWTRSSDSRSSNTSPPPLHPIRPPSPPACSQSRHRPSWAPSSLSVHTGRRPMRRSLRARSRRPESGSRRSVQFHAHCICSPTGRCPPEGAEG